MRLKTILFAVALGFVTVNVTAQEIRVEDISFKGNKQVSDGKLLKAIQTQANPWYRFLIFWMASKIYDEDTFLTDLMRIEKYYQQEGYLQAKIKDYQFKFNKKGNEISIDVAIEEGQPTKVRDVSFVINADSAHGFTSHQLEKIMQLKTGRRYREEHLKLDYNKILDYFGNRGYPYVEARVMPTLEPMQHIVDLEWYLNLGPLCRFGEIVYSGNNHISNKVIRRGLGFSPGDLFKQNRLVNAQSQVYRLELFQFVSLRATGLDERPQDIPIEVKVRETDLHTIKFGLGYGSEEAFRGFWQLRYRNFLGGARILRLSAKHSTRLLPLDLELELSQPYFLSNRNDLIVKPFFKWQDEASFEAKRVGAETTLNRRLTSKTNAFISAIVERDTVRATGKIVDPEVEKLFNKSILRVGFNHNSSDQIFTPSRGRVSSFYVEEAGRFLKTPFKYLKIFTEHKLYKKVDEKSVIAFKVAAGAMKPIRDSDQTPLEERFFAGGNYSVRGWARQELGPSERDSLNKIVPFGGDSVTEGSLELRRSLFKQFAGAVFLDYGNVWENWDGFDLTSLHYAVGAGLRYNTLIGPIRFDFAWKVNKQKLDTGRFQFHFSIGQAF